MALTDLEFLQGSITLAFVVISVILGISIMLRYRANKQVEFLLVGITWVFLMSGYYPDAINFVDILATNTQIPDLLYLTLATVFYPVLHVTWMQVFTELRYKEKQKTIMTVFWIESVAYEVYLVFSLVTNPAEVGIHLAPFYASFGTFVIIYFVASMALFLITGISFALFYLKSTSRENRLKGYFLLVAFVLFIVGVFIDLIFQPVTPLSLVVARVVLIIAGFEFFIGFVMPHWIKLIFVGEKVVKEKG